MAQWIITVTQDFESDLELQEEVEDEAIAFFTEDPVALFNGATWEARKIA